MQNVVKELAMAGALRKTMVYLGLAEEDERYDTYDDFDEPSSHHETPARDERAPVMNLPHRTPVARVVRDVEVGALNRIATTRTPSVSWTSELAWCSVCMAPSSALPARCSCCRRLTSK